MRTSAARSAAQAPPRARTAAAPVEQVGLRLLQHLHGQHGGARREVEHAAVGLAGGGAGGLGGRHGAHAQLRGRAGAGAGESESCRWRRRRQANGGAGRCGLLQPRGCAPGSPRPSRAPSRPPVSGLGRWGRREPRSAGDGLRGGPTCCLPAARVARWPRVARRVPATAWVAAQACMFLPRGLCGEGELEMGPGIASRNCGLAGRRPEIVRRRFAPPGWRQNWAQAAGRSAPPACNCKLEAQRLAAI